MTGQMRGDPLAWSNDDIRGRGTQGCCKMLLPRTGTLILVRGMVNGCASAACDFSLWPDPGSNPSRRLDKPTVKTNSVNQRLVQPVAASNGPSIERHCEMDT